MGARHVAIHTWVDLAKSKIDRSPRSLSQTQAQGVRWNRSFVPTARNHPKLIIGQNQFIAHRGVGKIGTWRCSQHSKGCKARVFTFAIGTEIKYRFSCAAHIHRTVDTKSTYFKKKLAKKFDSQE